MKREEWNRRYAGVENLWSAKPNRFLVAEVAHLPPGRALDLACGEGQNAIWLATLGWDVTGVDFSDVAIDKARARAERDRVDVDFVCADLLTYEPEDAYDLVVLLYFHLPPDDLRQVLAGGMSALAAGGTIVVLGHDRTNITAGVGGPSDPAIHYTPDELATALRGLEIEKATRVHRDVDGADRPAIDALVRARRRA